jgi:hypothetical protein
MEVLIHISRNLDFGKMIGYVCGENRDPLATLLDVTTLEVHLRDPAIKLGYIIFEDDVWVPHHEGDDAAYVWCRDHGLPNGGRRPDSPWLVEAVASLFPVSWLPIGLTFEGQSTLWSREKG